MEIFILFALLIIAHFIGQYAQNKGRSYWGFAGLSLLCLPIGLIAAVLATPNQEIVALSSNQVKCRFCAEYIKKEAKICKYCQREQALSESEKIEGEAKLVAESLPKELPPIAESTEKIKSIQSIYWAFGIFSIFLTVYFTLRGTPPESYKDSVIRHEREAREGSEISDDQHSKIEDDQVAARERARLYKYNQDFEERYAKEAAIAAASPSVQAELPEIAAVVDEVALPPLTEEPVNK